MKYLAVVFALIVVLFGMASATICATDRRSNRPQNFDSLGKMHAENSRGGRKYFLSVVVLKEHRSLCKDFIWFSIFSLFSYQNTRMHTMAIAEQNQMLQFQKYKSMTFVIWILFQTTIDVTECSKGAINRWLIRQ